VLSFTVGFVNYPATSRMRGQVKLKPEATLVPPVWNWYRALCLLLALINVAISVGGFWTMTDGVEMAFAAARPQADIDLLAHGGLFLFWAGIVFGILNLLILRLPKRPWAYLVHLGNLLAAIPFICPAPFAIPVLIHWVRPETRQFFGMK
jgi:hypothetical protein